MAKVLWFTLKVKFIQKANGLKSVKRYSKLMNNSMKNHSHSQNPLIFHDLSHHTVIETDCLETLIRIAQYIQAYKGFLSLCRQLVALLIL